MPHTHDTTTHHHHGQGCCSSSSSSSSSSPSPEAQAEGGGGGGGGGGPLLAIAHTVDGRDHIGLVDTADGSTECFAAPTDVKLKVRL
jgi:hypothetical protein